MATYRCLADIRGKTLEFGDIVILKDIEYIVQSKYLHEKYYADNSKIFKILSIPSRGKFATRAYGYEYCGGDWPECKQNDYKALTRLVIELYKIIEEKTSTYAIEVSPTTEITTTKKEEKYETQFQRKKARIERGTRPEGNTICGRRSKASIAVGHLGYRKVTGI